VSDVVPDGVKKKKKKKKKAPTSQSSTNPTEQGAAPELVNFKHQFYLKHVAFVLKDEKSWMAPKKEDEKKFAGLADSLALVGIIKSQREKKKKITDKEAETTGEKGEKKKKKTPPEYEYEVNWTTTRFQSSSLIRFIPISKVIEGMSRFSQMRRGRALQWEQLVEVPRAERVNFEIEPDELEELPDQFYEEYTSELRTHEDVERVEGLEYNIGETIDIPNDLFSHPDGGTETRIKESSRKIFRHSASSAFFAYLPRVFWNAVVEQTNRYAKDKKETSVTMSELMKFFGILFYMATEKKGEMSLYWGDQAESLLGISSLHLDSIMSFERFKFILSNLCFNCDVTEDQLKVDPAARLRPLINALKQQSTKHVLLGRNVSVDEASVACRSKFARGLIVYNATKPTGKYHFKMYISACATTWLAFGFKLHCASNMDTRIRATTTEEERQALEKDLQYSSEVRRHVLEVTKSIYGTNRIVNTDNFYTSASLLLSLQTVGLYGRGTVRRGSKHFPSYVILPSNDKDLSRGDMIIAVNKPSRIVAISWMDGSVVNMLSNADSSEVTTVNRQIRSSKVQFKAPAVVKEYNAAMQGVDRLDQLRARFSISDGHSFKKWHKKLAMAFIDIARVNAYVTRRLADEDEATDRSRAKSRDPHRFFMYELIADLISGDWAKALDSQTMAVGFSGETQQSTPSKPSQAEISTAPSPCATCESYASKHINTHLGKKSRDARGCVVCSHEGRKVTQVTDYCQIHMVCLCRKLYTRDDQENPGLLLVSSVDSDEYNYEWTCWDKFHRYYLPRQLFNLNGNIRKHSEMHQESKLLKTEREIQRKAKKIQLERKRRGTERERLTTVEEDVDLLVEQPQPAAHEEQSPASTLNSSFVSNASTDYF